MELWDLYDHHMTKTGEIHERGKPVPEGRYHMVVHVAIFNDAGEMLIQQRQPFKDGWPNMWDVTCGGSATAGDTSQSAASRELREELGLEVDFEDERPRLTIHFSCGFDDIYTLIWNVDVADLVLQKEEVQAARWASEEEIHRMVDAGEFIPYHHSLITLLFHLSRKRGTVSERDPSKDAK